MLLSLFALAARAAQPYTLAEAMDTASERAVGVQGAALDVRSAEAGVQALDAATDTQLRAQAGYTSDTREGAGQFGKFFAETGGWSTSVGADRAFWTGTSLGFDMSSTQTKFLYRLADAGVEFTDAPQVQSRLAVRLTQQLLEGAGRRWNLAQRDAASRGRDAAELDRRAQAGRARADAARAFRAVHLAREGVTVADETLAASRASAAVVAALVAEGRAAPVEATRAELALGQAEQARAQAVATWEDAALALARLLGEPTPERTRDIRWGETCAVPERGLLDALGAPDVLARLQDANPELGAARRRVEAARRRVDGARRSLLPSVAANASAGLNGFEPSVGASLGELAGGSLPEWAFGATVQVPLGNRADRSALERAEVDLARAELAEAELVRALAQGHASNLRAWELGARSMGVARANEALAAQALSVEEARLAEGRGLVRDVTEARRAQAQARVDRVRSAVACADATSELLRLFDVPEREDADLRALVRP
jgi:outer membrane protein TolC